MCPAHRTLAAPPLALTRTRTTQATVYTILIVPLFLSRSAYNIAAICPCTNISAFCGRRRSRETLLHSLALASRVAEMWGYKWTFLSDESALKDDDSGYMCATIPYAAVARPVFSLAPGCPAAASHSLLGRYFCGRLFP